MTINVLEYLEKSAAYSPGKTAIVDETGRITFLELLNKAKSIGSYINAQTTGAVNRPVVVYVGRNLESIVSFMGILYSGNFYVPVDAQTPPARLEKILGDLGPVASIPATEAIPKASVSKHAGLTINYDEAVNYSVNEDALLKIRRRSIDKDPVYTIFTSGSTGFPKGAVICHNGVIDLAEWLSDTFGLSENDIIGNQTPFYFDGSVKDIYIFLKNASTMYILPKKLFSFPVTLVNYLNENRINTILWATSAVKLLVNSGVFGKVSPRFLRKIFFAGENMPAKYINDWRKYLPAAEYVNLYGPTEITVDAAYHKLNRDYADSESIPIGIPCRNKEILLVKDDGELAGEGETGEIYVRGSGVSFGYYNDFEKTDDAFIQNPFNKHYREFVYKTGDLAKLNEFGELVFVSREDSQIKHMGSRIELGEIEAAAYSLPLIKEAVCVYDEKREAIVLIHQGADKLYIANGLRDKLPKYMIPAIFIELKKMPENANGKIDRVTLKSDYLSGNLCADRYITNEPSIAMKKIAEIDELNKLLSLWLRKKHITNDFTFHSEYEKLINEGRLFYLTQENGIVLLSDMENYYRMYYHLSNTEKHCHTLADKPIVAEIAYKNNNIPEELASNYLVKSGFSRAQKRLGMTAPTDSFNITSYTMEGVGIDFANVINFDAVHKLFADCFDVFVGFLPTRNELKASIINKEVLCFFDEKNEVNGALHFVKERKASRLMRVAVAERARGKGVAKALLHSWKSASCECDKFMLWVREDNSPARSMYEKSGFVYDGREAITLVNYQAASCGASV